MSSIKSLGVYCASSGAVDDRYKETARITGQYCAQNGIEIVYGGGHVGLMGLAADMALKHGGAVTGVIPEFLKDLEVGHTSLTRMITTKTMQERQAKMAELSDAFLILPGGLGTLAEFFEVLTWKQLHLHEKPIYVWNVDQYWDGLLGTIDQMHDKGFIRQNPNDLYRVIGSITEI